MTDTTPISTVEADDSATAAQVGSLEHLDPNAAALGENVRDAVDLSKDFLTSLREHGVLVPLTAVRGDDGVVRIRDGSLSSSRVVVDPCGAAECCRGCDRTR